MLTDRSSERIFGIVCEKMRRKWEIFAVSNVLIVACRSAVKEGSRGILQKTLHQRIATKKICSVCGLCRNLIPKPSQELRQFSRELARELFSQRNDAILPTV